MGQSFLFPGMDTEHLSPYQRQLEKLYDQVDRPGHRIASSQFFTSPEYQQFIVGQYGEIPVPAGHQVVESSPTKLVTKDAQGFNHTYTMDVAGGREGGQIIEQTDRPPIMPASEGQQSLTRQLEESLTRSLTSPMALAELDEGTKASLAAMDAAEKAYLKQQQEQSQGDLLARLYGSGVQQSSIAGENAARIIQQFGLVNQQQQSDAAARDLGLRQYLTGAGLEQAQLGSSTYANLLNQALQREAGAAGLTLDYKKLEETIRQANMQNTLGQLQVQTEQEKLDAQNSVFNKVMAGIGAAASIAGAPFTGGASLAGLSGTFSNLFKGGGSGAITGAGSAWPQN